MTWISFIDTHSELVCLNVEDQIHLARMASVAKGQDPGAKFIYFSACSLVVRIYLARFQLRDLWFLGWLRWSEWNSLLWKNEMEILVNPIKHNVMDVTAQVGSALPR